MCYDVDMQKLLSDNDIRQLRTMNRIGMNEVALAEGDLIIALDVTTGIRRIISVENIILESTKTLLLD